MATECGLRRCTKCGQIKPVTDFGKHACMRDGLRSQCRACHNIAVAEYNAANAEKVKASRARRYAANPGSAIAAVAKWRADHPEKRRVATVKQYAANPEKFKARYAKWKAANPEALRIHDQNRRARKRENGGKLSTDIAAKLFRLQRGKCAYCKTPLGDKYHRDHHVPLALGGPNEDWNMQLLCKPCNLQKGAKHPIEFMQQRGFLL